MNFACFPYEMNPTLEAKKTYTCNQNATNNFILPLHNDNIVDNKSFGKILCRLQLILP